MPRLTIHLVFPCLFLGLMSLAHGQPPSAPGSDKSQAPRLDRLGDPLPQGALARLGTNRLRHQGAVRCVAFSPDGKLIASGGDDNTVRLWDASTGKEVRCLKGHKETVCGLAFTPDGKTLLSTDQRNVIFFWDTASGREINRLGHKDRSIANSTSLAISTDGNLLATAGLAAVTCWELDTLTVLSEVDPSQVFDKELAQLVPGGGRSSADFRSLPESQRDVALAPDGKLIAFTHDKEIFLANPHTGKVVSHIMQPDRLRKKKGRGGADDSLSAEFRRIAAKLAGLLSSSGDIVPTYDYTAFHCVAFSPDGKLLATAEKHYVSFWDVATGRPVRQIPGLTDATSLRFSPDGKKVAAGGRGQITICEIATGKCRQLKMPSRIGSVAFSPDGRLLASGGDDYRVRLWDVTTGKEQEIPAGTPQGQTTARLSADGRTLATLETGGVIRLWNPSKATVIRQLEKKSPKLATIALSPDGSILAAGAADVEVHLWDTATGKFLRTCGSSPPICPALAFTPDGKALVVAGTRGNSITLFDVQTGDKVRTWKGHNGSLTAAAVSPDGLRLVTASEDRTIRLWDVAKGKELQKLKGHGGGAVVSQLVFSRDGKMLISAGNDGLLCVWDTRDYRMLRRIPLEADLPACLALSPDGKTAVSISMPALSSSFQEEILRGMLPRYDSPSEERPSVQPDTKKTHISLWDVTSGNQVGRLIGHGNNVHHAAFLPDGKTLLTMHADGTGLLWDVAATNTNQGADARRSPHQGADASRSPARMRTDLNGDSLPVQARARMGSLRFRLASYPDYVHRRVYSVRCAAFSPDGKTLAVSMGPGSDEGIRFLDVATGKVLHSLDGHATQLAFSPDGKTLAGYAQGRVTFWEAATGRRLGTLIQHPLHNSIMAFSPDGKSLATTGAFGTDANKTITLWNFATGEEVRSLKEHKYPVQGVAFSPDGKHLLSWCDGQPQALSQEARTARLVMESLQFKPKSVGVIYLLANSAPWADRECRQPQLSIQWWDLTTGKVVLRHECKGRVLIASSDGKTVAYRNHEGHQQIWDMETNKPLHKLEDTYGFMFSPDGKSLFLRDSDGKSHVLDVGTGKKRLTFDDLDSGWAYLLAISPDSRLVAFVDNGNMLRFFDLATGKDIHSRLDRRGYITAVAVTPDGKKAFSGSTDGTLQAWTPDTGKELYRHGLPPEGQRTRGRSAITALSVSPDGKTLAVGDSRNAVILREAATGKELVRLDEEQGEIAVTQLVFRPDGKQLVAVNRDGVVRTWDLATRKLLRRFKASKGGALTITLSPEGKRIALVDLVPERPDLSEVRLIIHLLDAMTGDRIGQIIGDNNFHARSLAFSPDGKCLAGSVGHGHVFRGVGVQLGCAVMDSPASSIRIWEVASGKEVYSLKMEPGVAMIAYAPDGNTLLGWGRAENYSHGPESRLTPSIRVFDLARKTEVACLEGHLNEVTSVALSRDGKVLISGGKDGTALSWDTSAFPLPLAPRSSPLAKDLTAERVTALWSRINGSDAVKSYEAIHALAAFPHQTVPLLRDRLQPAQAPDSRHIAKLIANLDSESFAIRESATRELEKYNELAETALKKAVADKISLEVTYRARALLDRLNGPALESRRLRATRATTLLERMGTPEARQLLMHLAAGAPHGWLTREAKASLERLRQR